MQLPDEFSLSECTDREIAIYWRGFQSGESIEKYNWIRRGPFCVHINWYPLRLFRYVRSKLRGELRGLDFDRWYKWWPENR